MMIIYKGRLAIISNLDNGTEMILDYVDKGAILNSHTYLASRTSPVLIQCYTSVTYYYLPFAILVQIAQAYPALQASLAIAQKKVQYDKLLDLNMLDYHETNFVFEEKVDMQPHLHFTPEEKKRVPELRLMLKNAVLHYLQQNRKIHENNSIVYILQQLAKKQKQKRQLKEKQEAEIKSMSLLQRLETLETNTARISQDRFDKLK